MYSQKLLVLSTYPKIKIAAFQWTICGAWQYLATALTAFAISVLVNKAIHKIALIISRKGKRIIGSSTSKFQILQVVGIGMPLPHSTLYFSPDTISVVSRNTIHQHRIRELAEPENMKLHSAYVTVTMETIEKQNASVPNPTAVASAAAAPFRSHGVAAARAIQHILLGEISCRSQRIDSTRSRGWVVQSRD